MQARYGPCVTLPTFMYHHVQDKDAAAANNQTGLTVTPDIFRGHLQYLRDKGYQPTSPSVLTNFFDAGTAPPSKSVLLTFDDGYADFYATAFPLLREFGFPATVFLATGLVDNPGYLSWNQIAEMGGQNIYFANHTWSHKNVATATSVVEQEISTAQTQLEDHGLNSARVFAYPYGLGNGISQNYLASHNYSLAFTTLPGRILCRGQRLTLPRIRVGNSRLDNYLP